MYGSRSISYFILLLAENDCAAQWSVESVDIFLSGFLINRTFSEQDRTIFLIINVFIVIFHNIEYVHVEYIFLINKN